MKFDEPPADVEWNDWGPPVRVVIERGPVMLFARAVKDDRPEYGTDEGPVPSYPIASVVDCRSPVNIELGVCLASRWAIRDAALASMRQAMSGQDHPRGP